MAEDDPLHARILASHAAFTESVRRYHEITERAYLNARAEDR